MSKLNEAINEVLGVAGESKESSIELATIRENAEVDIWKYLSKEYTDSLSTLPNGMKLTVRLEEFQGKILMKILATGPRAPGTGAIPIRGSNDDFLVDYKKFLYVLEGTLKGIRKDLVAYEKAENDAWDSKYRKGSK